MVVQALEIWKMMRGVVRGLCYSKEGNVETTVDGKIFRKFYSNDRYRTRYEHNCKHIQK